MEVNMDYRYAFEILGIEEVMDEGAIKAAYRNKLQTCNPEDEPERFMKLREAYETLVDYVKNASYEENIESEDAKAFVDAVAELYSDFERRLKPEEWAEVLNCEFCISLETTDVACEKLLAYLMDHYRMPDTVWKCIDSVFDIVENKEKLCQLFPRDFIDFVINRVTNEDVFPLDKVELVDALKNTNIDDYFSLLFKINAAVSDLQWEENADIEAIENGFNSLDEYGLMHPYQNTLLLQFLVYKKDFEGAKLLVQKILQNDYTDDEIFYQIARYYWEVEDYDKSYEYVNKVLEIEPSHYMARFYLAKYEHNNGRYYECRDILESLAEMNPSDRQAGELLRANNEEYLKVLMQEYENGIEDEHFKEDLLPIEICWCLYQNNQVDKCVEILETFEPSEENKYTYTNLFGRVLCTQGDFERGYPYLVEWNKMLEEMKDDGTEKTRKRLTRKAMAASMLGSCCFELGKNEEAISYYEKAILLTNSAGEKLNTIYQLAGIYFEMEEFEKCLEKCDEMIAIDSGYYYAYLLRQKTFFELRMGQGVIDDYYNAVNIYDKHSQPYYYAAEMFFRVAQDDDCMSVIERARENGAVFTARMRLLEVKLKRIITEDKSEDTYNAFLEELDAIEELKDTELYDLEEPAEVDYIRGLVWWNIEALDGTKENTLEKRNKVKEYLGKYISACPKNLGGYTSYCDFIMHPSRRDAEGKYLREAEKYYNMAIENVGRAPSVIYGLGMVYYIEDKDDEAAKYFEEVLQENDTYRNACPILKTYYLDLYSDNYDPKNLERAMEMANRELGAEENSDNYLQRGLVYLRAYKLEEAIADFEKSVEGDPENWSAYNNLGCCYQYMAEYDKAIEYYNKALELLKKDNRKSTKPYNNMVTCYRASNEYLKANECYLKNVEEMDYDKEEAYKEIAKNYMYLEDFDNSFDASLKASSKDDYQHREHISSLEARRDMDEAIKIAKKNVKLFKNTDSYADALKHLADLYSENGKDFDKAVEYYIKALEAAEDKKSNNFVRNINCGIVLNSKFAGIDVDKKYIDNIKGFLDDFKKDFENKMNYLQNKPANLGVYAELLMCLGEYDLAEEALMEMDKNYKCRFCSHKGCFEKYTYLGNIYFIKRDYEMAKKMYEKGVELSGNTSNLRYIIKYFEEMIKAEKESNK